MYIFGLVCYCTAAWLQAAEQYRYELRGRAVLNLDEQHSFQCIKAIYKIEFRIQSLHLSNLNLANKSDPVPRPYDGCGVAALRLVADIPDETGIGKGTFSGIVFGFRNATPGVMNFNFFST